MNIEQMNQILCVLSCGSINKAAEKLNISQGGLSASIKTAENELGQPIFIRSNHGISLTPFGFEFVNTAHKITEIYNNFLATSISTEKDRLYVSSQFLFYAGIAFATICSNNTLSDAKFRFTEKDTDSVLQDIIDGTSDIGIIVTPSIKRDILFQILNELNISGNIICTDESRCLVGPNNPLYYNTSDYIQLYDLTEFPSLEYEPYGILTSRKIFQEQNDLFPNSATITISDTGSFRQLLEKTNCFFIGIYNENAYSKIDFYNNIRVLKISDLDFTYDTIWLRRKNSSLKPLAKEYLQLLYKLSSTEPAKCIL